MFEQGWKSLNQKYGDYPINMGKDHYIHY